MKKFLSFLKEDEVSEISLIDYLKLELSFTL